MDCCNLRLSDDDDLLGTATFSLKVLGKQEDQRGLGLVLMLKLDDSILNFCRVIFYCDF